MKTLRQLKDYDTISLNMSTEECKNNIRELYKNGECNESLPIYLPLEEGVIKSLELTKDGNIINYIYFKDCDGYIFAEYYFYNRDTYDFGYLMTLKIAEFSDTRDKFELIDYNKDNKDDLEKRSTIMYGILETLLLYICFTKDNPKTRVAKKRLNKSNNYNSGNNNVRSRHIVKLGEKVLYEANFSDNSSKKFKKRQRHTESWTVMGFQRRLKSGKTIMVKPHVRGKGKKEKKDYIIK